MNIFVAGVHGVGKTFLASQIPVGLALTHTSASKLIRDEREMSTWGKDKKVVDVDANQRALVAAVKRRNDAGERLLIDGHFVVLGTQGEFLPLGTDVFSALKLGGVVLIEADPVTIATRLRERDGTDKSTQYFNDFMAAERLQAQLVCHELGISPLILESPTPESFIEGISRLATPAF